MRSTAFVTKGFAQYPSLLTLLILMFVDSSSFWRYSLIADECMFTVLFIFIARLYSFY